MQVIYLDSLKTIETLLGHEGIKTELIWSNLPRAQPQNIPIWDFFFLEP